MVIVRRIFDFQADLHGDFAGKRQQFEVADTQPADFDFECGFGCGLSLSQMHF